jgi:hypothetical protein
LDGHHKIDRSVVLSEVLFVAWLRIEDPPVEQDGQRRTPGVARMHVDDFEHCHCGRNSGWVDRAAVVVASRESQHRGWVSPVCGLRREQGVQGGKDRLRAVRRRAWDG